MEVDGVTRSAGAGAAAMLPRGMTHSFVVTSPEARFLTIHTPAGFERFAVQAGEPAVSLDAPPDVPPPDPAQLAAMASLYGIEILGPPPMP